MTTRVPLDEGECMWYLMKLDDGEFAIQYNGPHPEENFPPNLDG